MGELEKVAQQCDRSADELEQWTLWQGPEVGCYQTLDKKKELLTTFCSVVACENPVPHAKVKQTAMRVNLLSVGWSGLLMRGQGRCWGC